MILAISVCSGWDSPSACSCYFRPILGEFLLFPATDSLRTYWHSRILHWPWKLMNGCQLIPSASRITRPVAVFSGWVSAHVLAKACDPLGRWLVQFLLLLQCNEWLLVDTERVLCDLSRHYFWMTLVDFSGGVSPHVLEMPHHPVSGWIFQCLLAVESVNGCHLIQNASCTTRPGRPV